MPQFLIEALESDRDAGVDFACKMVDEIRQSGAFDGAHLIPVLTIPARLLPAWNEPLTPTIRLRSTAAIR